MNINPKDAREQFEIQDTFVINEYTYNDRKENRQ